REGHGRRYGKISAPMEARGAGRIRELPSVGLFQVRPWRALLLPHAPPGGIRRHPRAGQALGARSVSQGSQLRDAELFVLSPRCCALAATPRAAHRSYAVKTALERAARTPSRRSARLAFFLCADRVGHALLHMAGFCGAGEVLLLGVGLTGRCCIAL